MNLIFVSILDINKIAIQNKVALKCNTDKEDIQKVAKTFFNEVCDMDKLNPKFYSYEIFIKDSNNFHKIVLEKV